MGHHLDLAITNLRDVDGVAQVTDAAFDLDLVVEKLFESGQIKDLVADRLGAVDGVLLGHLGRLAFLCFWDWRHFE